MARDYNPVGWFEIPAGDLDRAAAFYQAVLGVELTRHSMGPLQMAWFPMSQAPGATGSLVRAEGYTPSHAGTLVYFSVEDVEAALARVAGAGGEVLNPKTSIGEYGFVGHIQDTEGNRVGLHSER